MVVFLILLLLCVMQTTSEDGRETAKKRNAARMVRRRAEQEARDKFEEEHSASFDDYGRVIRYGTDADKVSCEEKQTAKWKCHVEEYSRRKYLTATEKLTAKQLRADKQEELDQGYGSQGAESAVKRARFKKEQKARCKVFAEWRVEFEKDDSSKKKTFFKNYFSKNYEDYAAYRKIAERGQISRKETKKAKKLKRHITLNIHEDKLPSQCNDDATRSMMIAILTHLGEVEDCIETPHKCNPEEL